MGYGLEMRLEFRVHGIVFVQETQKPLPHLLVRAYDRDLIFHDLLGDTTTDSEESQENASNSEKKITAPGFRGKGQVDAFTPGSSVFQEGSSLSPTGQIKPGDPTVSTSAQGQTRPSECLV